MVQLRVTRKLNFPTIRGGNTIAGHALPAGHGGNTWFHTWPWNVPVHQRLWAFGASFTWTVAPACAGGATAAMLAWHPARAVPLAVTRYVSPCRR